MVRNILARSLPNKFSGINSIVHFTANMPGDSERIDKDVLFWCDWNVKKIRPAVPLDLIDRLRANWIAHYSKIVGETVPVFSASANELYDLKFLGK